MVVVCCMAACHHADEGRAGAAGQPAAAFPGHRIAAGEGHTCVVRSDGAVWCWGRDAIGIDRDAAGPAPVIGLTGARSVFAHDGATCATTPRGLVCWGDNLFGQVRMPPTLDYHREPEPRIGADGELATTGALGPQGACLMRNDGGVACWGEIGSGMDLEEGTRFGVIPGAEQGKNAISGRRTTTSRPVSGIDGAVQVAFGIEHLCVLMADRTVTCMGSNRVGQLGRIEHDIEPFHPARPVPGLRDVVQLEAGLAATCARTAHGEVWCWGSNFFGHLGVRDVDKLVPHSSYVTIPGDPHDRYSPRPLRVEGLPPVRQLSVGATHACAITDDGVVYCWGSNAAGQLGDGTTERRALPVRMKGGDHAVDVAASSYGPESHTCVLLEAGRVQCVGRNGSGELGRPGDARELTLGDVEGIR
jgi:alpha-tubulin suppressor-like RCC1 family protein